MATESKEDAVERQSLSHSEMFTQILLMTLQSKTDHIDVNGLANIINNKHANPFVIDEDGNSLLHWCAWRKLPNLAKYLISTYSIHKFQTLNNLLQSPMHWASMSGDIESIKIYLEDTDLSYLSGDIDGYNCLHCAAQLNQAAVFEFFLFKFGNKLDVNCIDNKGRTVLHWAVFKEHTIMIEWLLQNITQNDDKLKQLMAIRDEYGDTAFHIAAKKDKIKAIRAVVANIKNDDILYDLMTVQNLNNKTCIQIAKEGGNSAMYKMLSRIINRKERLIWTILMDIYGDNALFNDVVISTSTMKQIGFVFTIYFFVMQIGGVLLYYFVFWTSILIIDVMFLFFAAVASILWLMTHWSDPGRIEKPSSTEVSDMFTQNDAETANNKYIEYLLSGETNKICVTCRCVKEFRSKHCAFCNHCVKKFDHHCPWIDNCIGDGNYKLFVWFMVQQTILMILFLVFSVIYYVNHGRDMSYILITVVVSVWFILSFGTSGFTMMQIVSHFKLITNGYTTNEFLNMVRYNYFRDKDGNLRNPFGIGCWRNWIIFFFEPCNKKLQNHKMMDIQDAPILAKAIRKKDSDHDIENADMHVHQKKCTKHDHNHN